MGKKIEKVNLITDDKMGTVNSGADLRAAGLKYQNYLGNIKEVIEIEKDPNKKEMSIFSSVMEHDLINRLDNDCLRESARAVLLKAPELFEADELTLVALLHKGSQDIDIIDRKIKNRFWVEYKKSLLQNKDFKLKNVLNGLCTKTIFNKRIADNSIKLAWFMQPPKNYVENLEALHEKAMEKLEEILSLSVSIRGKIDTKSASLVLKAIEMIDNRLKGAYVQRNENLNVQKNLSQTESASINKTKSIESIKEEIALLEGVTEAKGDVDVPEVSDD